MRALCQPPGKLLKGRLFPLCKASGSSLAGAVFCSSYPPVLHKRLQFIHYFSVEYIANMQVQRVFFAMAAITVNGL